MVVRIRYQNQPGGKLPARRDELASRAVTRQPAPPPGPITREEIAGGLASILSPISALFTAVAVWRIGQDVGFAANFFIQEGPFSHWQMWVVLAATVAATGMWLERRASGGGNKPATN